MTGYNYINPVLLHYMDKIVFSPLAAMTTNIECGYKADKWKEGSHLTISQSNNDSSWRVNDQNIVVENAIISLIASPLIKIEADIDGYNHPLFIKIKSEDEGIPDGVDVKVNFSDGMLHKIVPEPKTVPITYSTENIVIDANLSDWESIPSLPLPFMKTDKSDFRFCWKENGLYGCFKTKDSLVSINKERMYIDDSFEMFIDKTYCRGNELNEFTEQIIFAPLPENNGGKGYYQIITGNNISRTDIGIDVVWQPTPDGYIIEFFYPAEAFSPAKMEEGQIIGFNFALNDGGKPIKYFYCDKNNNQAYKRPLLWGAVKFSK